MYSDSTRVYAYYGVTTSEYYQIHSITIRSIGRRINGAYYIGRYTTANRNLNREFPIVAVLFIAHYLNIKISDFCKNEVVYPIISSIQHHFNIKTTSSLSLKHGCVQDKRSNLDWIFHQFRLSVVCWGWYIVQR